MSEHKENVTQLKVSVKTYELTLPAWFKPTLSCLPEYGQYNAMIARCEMPSSSKFHRYGGRGIKVCERWRRGEPSKTGFECFLEDMGRRPSKTHSIERMNNDGNYEPSNCKWATNKEQSNNRSNNKKISYKGNTLSMMATAERYGISYFVLRNRIGRGWPVEMAIENPHGIPPKPPQPATGARLPQTKLSEKAVAEIRASYHPDTMNMYDLASRFGVSPSNIHCILHRVTWKHVK